MFSRLRRLFGRAAEPGSARRFPIPLPTGALDAPVSGSTAPASGVLTIRGWAADANGSLAVDLTIDGAPFGRASLGVPRPDVAAALGPRHGLVGWEALVDLGPAAASRTVRIDASARTREGRVVPLGTVEVFVTPEASQASAHSAVAPESTEAEITTARRRLAALLERGPRRSRKATAERVFVFLHSFGRGGSQLILVERIRQLLIDRRARTAHVAVASPVDGPLRRVFEDLGCACHVTASLTPPTAIEYEQRIAELALWCRAQEFDVVVANTATASAAIDLAQRLGLPSLWMTYDTPVGRHLSPQLATSWPAYAQRQSWEALTQASVIVFDSAARRADYRGRTPEDRLVTLPGAIDLEAIDRFRATFDRDAARRRRGLAQGDTLILLHGSIFRHKGTPLLAQVFGALARERRAAESNTLRLALVGSHGDDLARAIAADLAARGVGDRVFLEPMGDDVMTWLGIADLAVCPSDRESMPRTVMEAMAFELPVVAPDVGDVGRLVRNDGDRPTGWLLPPNDPVALREALQRALDAPAEERRRRARAGAELVRERDAREGDRAWTALLDRLVVDAGLGSA